jgi:hypothetical protein
MQQMIILGIDRILRRFNLMKKAIQAKSVTQLVPVLFSRLSWGCFPL